MLNSEKKKKKRKKKKKFIYIFTITVAIHWLLGIRLVFKLGVNNWTITKQIYPWNHCNC